MASEGDSSSSLTCNGTPVDELRINDIKRELDERGLSKSGSKTQLTERLKAQLLLEKLQQDAAQSSGDEGKVPNIAIQKDKAGQNEFVRQYLQQQQRNLEIQMEVKKQVEDERKRKSADESSADETNSSEKAKPAPAEPEVTSPKKFKDDESNAQVAPVKEQTRMPRAARKSSRNASKAENGQEAETVKDRSRSTTPEAENIRERTRSGSSSSDRSPVAEKSRRGRKARQPRGGGKGTRGGGRRRGRQARKESSSPSSSPEEVMSKKKKRRTTSASSRSRSRSPQVTSPDVPTRRSGRRSSATVRYTPDHVTDAADEKKEESPVQRRSSRRKASDVAPQESPDGKLVSPVKDLERVKEVDKSMSKSPESVDDIVKGKETAVKIAEDNNGGQKIKKPVAKEDGDNEAKAEAMKESGGVERKSDVSIEKDKGQDDVPEKKVQVEPSVEEEKRKDASRTRKENRVEQSVLEMRRRSAAKERQIEKDKEENNKAEAKEDRQVEPVKGKEKGKEATKTEQDEVKEKDTNGAETKHDVGKDCNKTIITEHDVIKESIETSNEKANTAKETSVVHEKGSKQGTVEKSVPDGKGSEEAMETISVQDTIKKDEIVNARKDDLRREAKVVEEGKPDRLKECTTKDTVQRAKEDVQEENIQKDKNELQPDNDNIGNTESEVGTDAGSVQDMEDEKLDSESKKKSSLSRWKSRGSKPGLKATESAVPVGDNDSKNIPTPHEDDSKHTIPKSHEEEGKNIISEDISKSLEDDSKDMPKSHEEEGKKEEPHKNNRKPDRDEPEKISDVILPCPKDGDIQAPVQVEANLADVDKGNKGGKNDRKGSISPEDKRRRQRHSSSSSSSSRSRSPPKKRNRSNSSSSSSRSRSKSSSSDSSSDEESKTKSSKRRSMVAKRASPKSMEKVDTSIEVTAPSKERKDKEEESTKQEDTKAKITGEDITERTATSKKETDAKSVTVTAVSSDLKPPDVAEKDKDGEAKDTLTGDGDAKKEKVAKRRKWGSKTSKAAKVVRKPSSIEISSDSLKGLIGEVKMTETVFDVETELVNTLDYDEQEDDRRDIKMKRTVLQGSPQAEERTEEESVPMEEDARQVEDTNKVETDDVVEVIEEDARHVEQKEETETAEPAVVEVAEPAEPEKKIIRLVSKDWTKKKVKDKEGKKLKKKKDDGQAVVKENKADNSFKAEPKKVIATHRPSKPLVQQADEPERVTESKVPAKFPVSCVIKIIGLVRPFTLGQLKELLKRTGELDESMFWINSIKSECLAAYTNEDDAVKTRTALHGTRWPSSNPKILDVDFATIEELKHRQSGAVGPVPVKRLLSREEPPQPVDDKRDEERERRIRAREQRDKERLDRDKEDREKRDQERQKRREAERKNPVREWDRDKIQQLSRSRSRSKGREEDRSSRRSRERGGRDKEDRKRRDRSGDERKEDEKKKEKKAKADEEPPAKLLDDLFRKTKATPCIYWLPLTEEQAQVRQTEKEEREKERQKRIAAIEERHKQEEKKREAARQERIREREKERNKERERNKEKERARDSGRDRGRQNRDRSSKSRSSSRSRSRRGR